MISPWEIYWILQLDSIRDFFGAGVFLFGAAGLMATIFAPILFDSYSDFKASPKKVFGWIGSGLLVFSAALCFTPSTKTAAAMFIIPAIANNEAIQKEAGDLYSLAKQALTEAIKPDDEPKK